jgi:hypothetical protein
MKTFRPFKVVITYLFLSLVNITFAQDLSLNLGADVVSLYIWRGINVNDAVNIQPSFTLTVSGFSAGFWGSYGFTDNETYNAYKQEIDTWLNYTYEFSNGMSLGAIVTDYYYPSAGIPWGNFNNYDNPGGGGAHTIETGVLINGPSSFPLNIAGYVNVYNDAGFNTYFQADYLLSVVDVSLDFFIGAAGGSTENPNYYGTEKFNVINIGMKASKSIKITEEYSLPLATTFIINPNTNIAYLVFTLTF